MSPAVGQTAREVLSESPTMIMAVRSLPAAAGSRSEGMRTMPSNTHPNAVRTTDEAKVKSV